eukprot:scaffold617068_cov17-Prasinocladus_malaysianus.AAC.1
MGGPLVGVYKIWREARGLPPCRAAVIAKERRSIPGGRAFSLSTLVAFRVGPTPLNQGADVPHVEGAVPR